MGDFNAHFDDNHVALDSRASLVGNLSQVSWFGSYELAATGSREMDMGL